MGTKKKQPTKHRPIRRETNLTQGGERVLIANLRVIQLAKQSSCHHSMACPEAAGGGYDLQILRVAENVWNYQWRTVDLG